MKRCVTHLSLLIIFLALTSCTGDQHSSSEEFHSSWKVENVKEAIEASIQYDIPYLEASSYYAKTEKDEYNEPQLILGLSFENDDDLLTAMDNYYVACEEANWDVKIETVRNSDGVNIVEFNCGFADKVISEDLAIEIQFVIGKADPETTKDQLCIIAFTYVPVDQNVWPTHLLEHYLGFDIPHFEKEGASYNAQVSMDEQYKVPVVDIWIGNVDASAESEYYAILEAAGYAMDDSDYENGNGYYAFSKDGSHAICFYYNSYYGFVIYVYPITDAMK